MTLDQSFWSLQLKLEDVRDCLESVRMTVVEDRPRQGDAVLVDVFGDAADDLLGWLSEARVAADEAREALTPTVDLDRARRALATCHEHYTSMQHRFVSDVVHHERMTGLARLGRSRGGEWKVWAMSVIRGLDACHQPLYDTGVALLRCWQTVTEHITVPSMTVRTIDTGLHTATGAR